MHWVDWACGLLIDEPGQKRPSRTFAYSSTTKPTSIPMTNASAGTQAHDALAFIAKPTPQLRATIAAQESLLSSTDFAGLIGCIRSAFDKFTAKLLEFAPGIERASALHEMMDREIGVVASLPLSCRMGCSGCCHYEVEITQDEAESLREIVQNGFPIDRQRLYEQSTRERQDAAWGRLGNPANRCVFLGNAGACQIYEQRPAICRKHLVTSSPSLCTTQGGAVLPVQVILAEILLSAATSLEGATFGSLPKMLRAALQNENAEPGADVSAGGHAVPSISGGRVRVSG